MDFLNEKDALSTGREMRRKGGGESISFAGDRGSDKIIGEVKKMTISGQQRTKVRDLCKRFLRRW